MNSQRWCLWICGLLLLSPAALIRADVGRDLIDSLDVAKNDDQRITVVRKVGNLGRRGQEAVPVLDALLRHPNEKLANQAARSLAQIGAPAVPALAAASQDEDSAVNLRAVWALSLIGPEATEGLTDLLKLLNHPQERIRAAAVFAVGEIAPLDDDAAAMIVRTIRTPSPLVRYQAILAVRKAGPKIIPSLEALLHDDDAEARAAAGYAISLFGNKAKAAVPALEMALQDQHAQVREAAAYALGSMEKAAANTLPKLIDLIQDPEYDVQTVAFRAALAVGADDPRLMKALRDANKKGKWAVPFMLKEFAKNPQDAVDHLIKKLEGKDSGQRLSAAWALGQIGLPAKDAVPALEKALKDPQPQARVVAFMALRQINKEVFEFDHPLVKEWNDAVERKLEMLVENQRQFEQMIGGKRFQFSLQNAQVKRFYDQVVQLHVYRSLTKSKPLPKDTDRLLHFAGAEALTSLVQEVNKIAGLNVGFT